jgi:predicted acyltransferase
MSNENRLVSLDVFRGMTIAGMVLVNNPGTWSHIYDPLEHASWHGLTPTDWIFPFFLFIVGVAIPIALGKRVAEGVTGKVYAKIISRSVMIFAIGLLMSVIPFFQFAATDAPDWSKMLIWLAMTGGLLFLLLRNFKLAGVLIGLGIAGVVVLNLTGYNVVPYNFGTMRIPGVLQRIGVCYLAVSLIFLHTNWKQQAYIAAGILLGYWAIMTMIPVPGCEMTTIDDKACNLAAWLDRTILTEAHIWRSAKVFDPEGILSTLPAMATTIAGVLTGTWLTRRSADDDADMAGTADRKDGPNKVSGLFFFGTVLLAAGYVWNSYFPFNKALWTSSYVLVTAGLALLTLGACFWLIDIKGYKAWAKPFVIFGTNALPLFVFSGIFARMIGAYRVSGTDGQPVAVQKWVFDNVFMSVAQPVDASLLYAVCFILLWLFLMWLLYRKKIYIKL